jgi:cytochrome P450
MQRAHEAYVEWGKYMKEMIITKKAEIQCGNPSADLLSALVHGAGVSSHSQTCPGYSKNGGDEATSTPTSNDFTEKEVLGNAFGFILAGHETAGNSIHFVLISLALKVQSQRHMQREIASILGNRPPDEWSYDHDLPKLFGGMTGAVLHEQLRLVPPVTTIPKSVLGEDQGLVIDGKRVTVPARTSIGLISTGAHRNPKYWPHGPPTDPSNPGHPICNLDNDLEEFKPERWLLGEHEKPPRIIADTEFTRFSTTNNDSSGASTQAAENDTPHTSLFRPPRGAYIPFSEGHRSCLGRRFGQIEILAVLAVIFSRHSVELAVDDFATDQEIDRMTMAERKEVWDRAARRATDLMNNSLTQIITLKMSDNHVPLRFVKKGEERFNFS